MMQIPAKYRIPCLVSFLVFFFLSGCAEDRPTRPLYPATTFSLSGAVTASAPSVVDSDTNNPVHPLISNDSSDSAQQLESPLSLGGYLTAAATGGSGDRFAASSSFHE